jgi:hypothetical protein
MISAQPFRERAETLDLGRNSVGKQAATPETP